jgi:hypothetical protein
MTARATHTHTHTQFTAPAAHIQAEKKRVKEEGNERRSLNDVVWSIKKKCRNTERFENDKREQKNHRHV